MLLFCCCLFFIVVVSKIGFLCVALAVLELTLEIRLAFDSQTHRLPDSAFQGLGLSVCTTTAWQEDIFKSDFSVYINLGFGSQEANKNTGDYFWSQISEVTSITEYLKIKTWPARWLSGERCLLTDLSLVARSRVKVGQRLPPSHKPRAGKESFLHEVKKLELVPFFQVLGPKLPESGFEIYSSYALKHSKTLGRLLSQVPQAIVPCSVTGHACQKIKSAACPRNSSTLTVPFPNTRSNPPPFLITLSQPTTYAETPCGTRSHTRPTTSIPGRSLPWEGACAWHCLDGQELGAGEPRDLQ